MKTELFKVTTKGGCTKLCGALTSNNYPAVNSIRENEIIYQQIANVYPDVKYFKLAN